MTDQITGETNPRDIITKMKTKLSLLESQVQDKDIKIREMKQFIQNQATHIQALRQGLASDCFGGCYNAPRGLVECLYPGSMPDGVDFIFDMPLV